MSRRRNGKPRGVTSRRFTAACDAFERYDDQQIPFVDHTSTCVREYEIDHIFAFDSDFATLGLTRTPAGIHLPE